MTTRREVLAGALAVPAAAAASGVTRYVRFSKRPHIAYGILDGDMIRELSGPPFTKVEETGTRYKLAEVKLLYPSSPRKVFAVGLNYKSHIGNRTPPSRPEIFYKPTSSLQNPGDPIVIPEGAKNVHYEGELVLVIGHRTSKASREHAREAIFGVTCGNDVSERDWQNGADKDLQWWRAKGADTFGPLGPWIAAGLDYRDLLLQTRLNGQVVQKQSTSDLLFDPPAIVSWISRFVTLMPGDVVYTGTPGQTKPITTGDVVEVEIEGIGVLKNPVRA